MNQTPIHINPDHRGKFTAWAKAHGFKTVQEAADHVMANKSRYPKEIVEEANFAKNFSGKGTASPKHQALKRLLGQE